MDVATEPDLVFIDSGVLKHQGIFLRLDSEFDDFAIRLEEPDILDEVILLYLMWIVPGSYLDNNSVSLFLIKRDMARFLFGDPLEGKHLLYMCRRFYESFFSFAAMGTCPRFIEILESGSRRYVLLSEEGVVDI